MMSPDWQATGWRLLFALAALGGLSVWQPFFWAELFSGLYAAVIAALLPTDAMYALGTRLDQAEPVVTLGITFAEAFPTSQGTLMPGMTAHLLTSAGHAVEPVIIILGICLAWSPLTFFQRTMALALAAPILCVLQIITVPFLLAGSFYTKICGPACPTAPLWAWEGWIRFLENGGDWSLSALAAVACIYLSARVLPRKESAY